MYNNSEKVNNKINKLNIIRQSLMTLDDTDAQNTNIVLYYINTGERIIKSKFNKLFSKIDIIAQNIVNNKNVQNIITFVDNYLNIFISNIIEKHKVIYDKIMNNLFNLDKKNKDINDEIDNNMKEIDNLMLELEQLKEKENESINNIDKDSELDEDFKKDIIKQKESLEFIKTINFKQMIDTIMKVKDMKGKDMKYNKND